MNKLLQPCFNFPNCSCFRGTMNFSRLVEEGVFRTAPLEDLDELVALDYFHLKCMAANAPPAWRVAASVLLNNPLYQTSERSIHEQRSVQTKARQLQRPSKTEQTCSSSVHGSLPVQRRDQTNPISRRLEAR